MLIHLVSIVDSVLKVKHQYTAIGLKVWRIFSTPKTQMDQLNYNGPRMMDSCCWSWCSNDGQLTAMNCLS